MNNLSRSDIISSGIPCYTNITLVNVYIRFSAFDDSRYGTKCTYFVRRSTITKILSKIAPVRGSFDFSSFTMKSSVIDDYAAPGIVGDCSFPYTACLECLALAHVS